MPTPHSSGTRLLRAVSGLGFVVLSAAAAIAAVMISFPISWATSRGDAVLAITLAFITIALAAGLSLAPMARPIKRLLSPPYLTAACVTPCVLVFVYGAIMAAAASFATIDKPFGDWRWTTWLGAFVCLVPSLAVACALVSARVNFAHPRRHLAVLGGAVGVLLISTAAAVFGVLVWTPRAA